MKIEKKDGLLYQWDTGREIVIKSEIEIHEVHFANCNSTEAMVLLPKDVDGILTADIPNNLLQEEREIYVWLVRQNKSGEETVYSQTIAVIPRKKPADYIYSETEVLRYETLEKRIMELDSSVDSRTANTVLYIKQKLTNEQKTQARTNIDAASAEDIETKFEELFEKHKLKVTNSAEPGQMIIVKSVDKNGQPTEWEAVNRTHWKEEPTETREETEIFPETTLAFANEAGIEVFQSRSSAKVDLVDGTTYSVIWDGEKYECICKVLIENGVSIPTIGDDTGTFIDYPFCIADYSLLGIESMNTIIVANDTAPSHTVHISKVDITVTQNIHKLDKEYLHTIEEQLTETEEIRGTSIEWNGDMTGKEIMDSGQGMVYVKISDIVPSIEDLLNGTIETKQVSGSGVQTIAITDMVSTDEIIITDETILSMYFTIAKVDLTMDGFSFSKGTYFFYSEAMNIFASKLTVNYSTIIEKINPLDKKYIDAEWMAKEEVVKVNPLTWDGSLTGKEYVIDSSTYFVKMSDDIVSDNELKNAVITVHQTDNTYTTINIADYWNNFVSSGFVTDDCTLIMNGSVFLCLCLIIKTDSGAKQFGAPGVGTYFCKLVDDSNNIYASSLSVSVTTKSIPKLPEKFLPDNIQRVGDDVIINSSTSGSTKKFKITVDDSGKVTATEV